MLSRIIAGIRQRAGDDAEAASLELRRTARLSDRGLELDLQALVSTQLLRARARMIAFCWLGHTVYVERAKLHELRKAMRPFRDAEAYLTPLGLHVRWRGGQGGLNLSQQLERKPRQRSALVFWVAFLVEV